MRMRYNLVSLSCDMLRYTRHDMIQIPSRPAGHIVCVANIAPEGNIANPLGIYIAACSQLRITRTTHILPRGNHNFILQDLRHQARCALILQNLFRLLRATYRYQNNSRRNTLLRNRLPHYHKPIFSFCFRRG